LLYSGDEDFFDGNAQSVSEEEQAHGSCDKVEEGKAPKNCISEPIMPKDSILNSHLNLSGIIMRDILGKNVHLFSKCALVQDLPGLTFFKDGTKVERPAGTHPGADSAIKSGREVFLCPQNRPLGIGKTYLVVGVVPNTKSHFHSNVILLERKDQTNLKGDQPTSFKAVPLKFVAKVPGGLEFDQTKHLLDNITEELHGFFQSVSGKQGCLTDHDVLQGRGKRVPSTANKPFQNDAVATAQSPFPKFQSRKQTVQQKQLTEVTPPPMKRLQLFVETKMNQLSAALKRQPAKTCAKCCKLEVEIIIICSSSTT
jgi:hypothetical protein